MGLGLITLWSIFKVKKCSREIVLLFSLFVFAQSLYMFYQSEHKLILLGTLFYLPMASFLCLLWGEELESSLFNPNFYKNQIYKKDKYPFRATLKDAQGREYVTQLTNWDEYSCFACVRPYEKGLRGLVNMRVSFLGREFMALGQVMTGYADGFGIKFTKKRGEKRIGPRLGGFLRYNDG